MDRAQRQDETELSSRDIARNAYKLLRARFFTLLKRCYLYAGLAFLVLVSRARALRGNSSAELRGSGAARVPARKRGCWFAHSRQFGGGLIGAYLHARAVIACYERLRGAVAWHRMAAQAFRGKPGVGRSRARTGGGARLAARAVLAAADSAGPRMLARRRSLIAARSAPRRVLPGTFAVLGWARCRGANALGRRRGKKYRGGPRFAARIFAAPARAVYGERRVHAVADCRRAVRAWRAAAFAVGFWRGSAPAGGRSGVYLCAFVAGLDGSARRNRYGALRRGLPGAENSR